MSYNDQDTYHLLIWINHQRKAIGQIRDIYSFHQIHGCSILPNILQRIHPKFFSDIISIHFNYSDYLSRIEDYLIEFQDVIIRKSYKTILIQNEYISQLIKLILFIIMKNNIKQQYISRILELEQQTQFYLMNELKKMEKNLQYKTNIKDIIKQIQSLQQQNQYLMKKLMDQNDKIKLIQIQKQLGIEENNALHAKYRLNNQQRIYFIQQINVSSNKDYWEIYQDFQKQNNQLNQQYSNLEQIITKTQQQNKDLEEKMQEDKYIIEHLNEEINKYRQIYNQIKTQDEQRLDSTVFNCFDKQNLNQKVSKEKGNNESMLQSLNQISYVSQYESNNTSFFQLDTFQENSLTIPTQQLNEQIECFKQRIFALDKEIKQLKQKKQKIKRQKAHNQKSIILAKSEYQQFHLNYQYQISG